MALACLVATGCTKSVVPRDIPRLTDADFGTTPGGRLGVAASESPGQVYDLGRGGDLKHRFADSRRWTEVFVEDLIAELATASVEVDPRAPLGVVVTIDAIALQSDLGNMHTFTCHLRVTTRDGSPVHAATYSERGFGRRRAVGGLLYRCKQGLLADPAFTDLIRP